MSKKRKTKSIMWFTGITHLKLAFRVIRKQALLKLKKAIAGEMQQSAQQIAMKKINT